MASEARRKCGYRKVGGLYLCGTGQGEPCCKMPILLHICPSCGHGIKQSRGWTWIDPREWLQGGCSGSAGTLCPLATDGGDLGDKVGLLWIGAEFYPTVREFMAEAHAMGISRRITAVPQGFKIGTHWIFLAHPRVKETVDPVTGDVTWTPGVFHVFKPKAIEKIVTESESHDEAAMKKLTARGITPVAVPDDDKDHRGTVYDKNDELDQKEMQL